MAVSKIRVSESTLAAAGRAGKPRPKTETETEASLLGGEISQSASILPAATLERYPRQERVQPRENRSARASQRQSKEPAKLQKTAFLGQSSLFSALFQPLLLGFELPLCHSLTQRSTAHQMQPAGGKGATRKVAFFSFSCRLAPKKPEF